MITMGVSMAHISVLGLMKMWPISIGIGAIIAQRKKNSDNFRKRGGQTVVMWSCKVIYIVARCIFITIGVFWRHNNFPWKTFVFCCTLCNLPTSYVMTWIDASTFPWCFENTITSSLHLLLPFHVDSCPHTSPQAKRFSANDKVKRNQQSSTGASNSPTLTEQWPGVSRHHKYFLDANFQFIHIHAYLLFIHCNMLLIYGIFIS